MLLCLDLGIARAADGAGGSAGALRAKYAELETRLGENSFDRPIHLDSIQSSAGAVGDAYALVEYPFVIVAAALSQPEHWCHAMNLHPNTKWCSATPTGEDSILAISVGRKSSQPLSDAHPMELVHRVTAIGPSYLKVSLRAEQGPLGTRDYRILFEAAELANETTFVHLSYSYAHGAAGALAIRSYFATIGSKKKGFTVVGVGSDGGPLYVGGERGAVERNTMRYILAIEASLGALSAPPQERFEKRLHDWFAAAERHPLQLHEMDQSEYLEMKRKEHARQVSPQSIATGAD